MSGNSLRGVALLIAFFAIGGCGWVSQVDAPAACGFPEGSAIAYAGETTLAALGLGRHSTFDHTFGRIYVTRDRVPFTGSVPITPHGPALVPDQRQYGAIWGEAMSRGGVADDWMPPR